MCGCHIKWPVISQVVLMREEADDDSRGAN